MKEKLRRLLPTRRRLIQLYAAMLYNAHARGFITGSIFTGMTKSLCVPGLNCYSCPGAVGACPLGALQNALASTGVRAPYYVLGMLMLFGLTLGRVICGWLCPVGLIQELLHRLPTPKVQKNRFTRALCWVKYAILLVFVIMIPLFAGFGGLPLPAFCKYICPAGTLEGGVGLLAHPDNAGHFSMLGWLFTHKFVLLVLISAACVFIYRAFCRFICPLGAIYGLFAKVSLLGVQVDRHKCTGCGNCLRRCPMDIRCVGDRECIQCGACAAVCPAEAIGWRCAAREEKARRRNRILSWAAAILLLAGVAVYANWPVPAEESAPIVSDLPVGSEVGMQAADFTVPVYGGGAFTLSEARGSVVVLNFWATWCGPCVKELPYFQQLADSYPHDVVVVPIHANLVTEDVAAWLTRNAYPTLPFALDETGEVLTGLGGSLMLPQTVIIDRQGTIVYNQPGSMTLEALMAQVQPLL